jgi:hypothetical protein
MLVILGAAIGYFLLTSSALSEPFVMRDCG